MYTILKNDTSVHVTNLFWKHMDICIHISTSCNHVQIYIYIHIHIYIVEASFEDMNPCAYNMQMYMQKKNMYIYIYTVFQMYFNVIHI
jgi:hypothetical protein